MSFIDTWRLNGGILQGQLIGSSSSFPWTYDSGAAGHQSVSQTFWEAGPIWHYFNTDISLQIDALSVLENIVPQSVDPTSIERRIASLPIYTGTGAARTQTGNLSMGVTRETPYRYVIRCYVTDTNNIELGSNWGSATLEYQSGGVWTGALWRAYLAFRQWSDGIGHTYVGLYLNLAELSEEPGASGEYGAWYGAGGGVIDLTRLYDTFGIHGSDMGVPVPFSPEYGPAADEEGYGPAEPGGPSGGSGGPGPTFDSVSDPWEDTPMKPGVLSYGLLNVYKCDQGALVNLGRDLFPEITWPPTTGFGDLLEWMGMTIQAFSDSIWNKDLIDYIVSIHLIPVDVTGGSLEDIKIGPRTMTGILARPISDDVIEFDCGTLHIDEYYTNYIDYMTRCRVYIPFYGMVTIKPEYWQSADLRLKYLWNVMDGSFIAKLYSTVTRHQKPCTTMIGQYSGNACVHMPLSGANYANMFASVAGAAGGMAAGVASGNVAMAATSAMNYAGSMGGQGDMQQSNAYNASSAFYGHACPFVIIERPVSQFSTRYATENGLPLLVSKKLSSCSGLTICEDPILNFACSDEEAREIIAALKEGVII